MLLILFGFFFFANNEQKTDFVHELRTNKRTIYRLHFYPQYLASVYFELWF